MRVQNCGTLWATEDFTSWRKNSKGNRSECCKNAKRWCEGTDQWAHSWQLSSTQRKFTAVRISHWKALWNGGWRPKHSQLILMEITKIVNRDIFYILLTVHHVMILGKWPTWRTFFIYLFTFLTLYMFRAHRAHHQERQIVSMQPLVACHSVSVAVSCAGRKFTSDSYQRLHWHNLSLLMMITMSSKQVES